VPEKKLLRGPTEKKKRRERLGNKIVMEGAKVPHEEGGGPAGKKGKRSEGKKAGVNKGLPKGT